MHGVSRRKLLDEREARILEASRHPGPIAAGMVAWEEKSRLVQTAAEQRRLLREAELTPAPNDANWLARAANAAHLVRARIAAWPRRTNRNPTATSST